MEQIKTATEKRFQSDYIAMIETPPRVYIRIVGRSLSEVVAIFGNPTETIQIWYGNQYFSNYTHLIAIVPESGAVKVILSKE